HRRQILQQADARPDLPRDEVTGLRSHQVRCEFRIRVRVAQPATQASRTIPLRRTAIPANRMMTARRRSIARLYAMARAQPPAKRILVGPKAPSDAASHDADKWRIRAIALQKFASLQKRLTNTFKISGHSGARVGEVKPAWLRCGSVFRIEGHQIPRRIHRRW